MTSPSRFISATGGTGTGAATNHQNDTSIGFNLGTANRLSIHPDRYEVENVCCLPPPSPAPNSDRYVMGMPSPGGGGGNSGCSSTVPSTSSSTTNASSGPHHYQDLKFSVHHRSMSPSSRYI